MKNKLRLALVILCLSISDISLGHGEDKPGPNGGHIRMPGAFHTELVVYKQNQFNVFLLDINWKNPTVKDSSVQLKVNNDKNIIQCKQLNNYFQCELPQLLDMNKPNIISVKAIREGAVGTEAIYHFPMKEFNEPNKTKIDKKEKPSNSNSPDHSGHH